MTEDIGRYDDGNLNFYYQQEDYMYEARERRKQWSYNIIRPFGIIGFTRQGTSPTPSEAPLLYTPSLTTFSPANGMNLSMSWAIYLLICRELGTTPHFPGSQVFLDSVEDISYAPNIADMTVWATTHEHTRNEDFNNASGDPVMFRYFWRELAAYFGMQACHPLFLHKTCLENTSLTSSFRRTTVSCRLTARWASGPRTSGPCGNASCSGTAAASTRSTRATGRGSIGRSRVTGPYSPALPRRADTAGRDTTPRSSAGRARSGRLRTPACCRSRNWLEVIEWLAGKSIAGAYILP